MATFSVWRSVLKPSDKSRLVNLTQTMVQAPQLVPKLVKRMKERSLSPELETAADSLLQGYEELREGFDQDAARKLAERLMSEESEGPKHSAGATLADSLDVLGR